MKRVICLSANVGELEQTFVYMKYLSYLYIMKGVKIKFDEATLRESAKNSSTIPEFLTKVGASLTSMSSRQRVKGLCISYNIDLTHFKRVSVSSPSRMSADDILIYNRRQGIREVTTRLRRALLDKGVKHQCVDCGIVDQWNGKAIKLEIDHINRNPVDNRLENLRFLCPNCHSQK